MYWVFDFLMIVGINFDTRPDTLWGFGAISKTCLTFVNFIELKRKWLSYYTA